MSPERYKLLMESDERLTEEEIGLGWHFCNEFDGLLVGPESYELHFCKCLDSDHPVYRTAPPEQPYSGEAF